MQLEAAQTFTKKNNCRTGGYKDNWQKQSCYKKLRIFDKKNRKKNDKRAMKKMIGQGKNEKDKKKMNTRQPEIFQFILWLYWINI